MSDINEENIEQEVKVKKPIDLSFLNNFNKAVKKMEGVSTSSQPPRYWYSTGSYVLNRIISGSFLKGIPQGRITDLAGSSGAGKAQPLDAKILTPNGWTTMGEIKVGDIVLTPSGEHSSVTHLHSQGPKEIYQITFSDGSTTKCCLEHLWECYIPKNCKGIGSNRRKEVVSTEFIINFLNTQKYNISIDLIQPVELPNIELPMNPYLLGVLLGDGGLTTSTPKITNADSEIIERIKDIIHEDNLGYHLNQIKNQITYSISSDLEHPNNSGPNKYMDILNQLGLAGLKSHNKFIPEIYKRGSIEQRLELVRGLMDTDGTVGKTGYTSYSSSSYQLAKDMQEIIWSLGGKCSLNKRYPFYRNKLGEKVPRLISYELGISFRNPKQLFSLTRQQDRCSEVYQEKQMRRQIKSVKLLEVTEAQCITIDHPSSLYITDDYIITHNSFLAANLIKSAQAAGAFCLVIDSENALDNSFMQKIGIDTNENYSYVEVTTIPQVTKIISTFINEYRSAYGEAEDAPEIVILIDSLDMLITDTELDNYDAGVARGDQGQRNKQLKAMLRTFVHDIKKLNIAMICTSQVYKNQDVKNGEGLWIVSDAVKYACSQIILLSKLKLRDDKTGIFSGIRMKCEGYKSRFCNPFQVVTIEVPYETGMDKYSGLCDTAIELGIVKRNGAWNNIIGSDVKFYAKDIYKYTDEILEKCEKLVDFKLKGMIDDIEDHEGDETLKQRKLNRFVE